MEMNKWLVLSVASCVWGMSVPTSIALAAGDGAAGAEFLTPQYLQGDWCYTHSQGRSGSADNTNINYRFEDDGNYQAGIYSDRRVTEATYEIFPDGRFKLSVIPAKLTVNSIGENSFILAIPTGIGMHFSRGRCDTRASTR